MSLFKNPGRRAGLLYLLLMGAPLRLVYIPAKLFVPGDAAATANNIVTHETLFRLGIAVDLFASVVVIFLSLAFCDLFRKVDSKTCRARGHPGRYPAVGDQFCECRQ